MQVSEGERPKAGRPVEVSIDNGKTWREDEISGYDSLDHTIHAKGIGEWLWFHGDEDNKSMRTLWRYIEMEM